MTKRNRDLARRARAPSPPGAGRPPVRRAGWPSRGGAVVDRVVPAQLACRIGARARAGERNAWPAVVSIALGSFALVFSEVIPVGLLGDISGHLRVSVGTGGVLGGVPPVTGARAAPPLPPCATRLQRGRGRGGLQPPGPGSPRVAASSRG